MNHYILRVMVSSNSCVAYNRRMRRGGCHVTAFSTAAVIMMIFGTKREFRIKTEYFVKGPVDEKLFPALSAVPIEVDAPLLLAFVLVVALEPSVFFIE